MLFNIPTRDGLSSLDIITKVSNEATESPKIKLKGKSLSAQLQAISERVEENLGADKGNYLLITDGVEWLNYCKNAIGHLIALDTETTGLTINDQKNLVGVCIQSDNQKPAYIPVGHISTLTEKRLGNQVDTELIKEGLLLLKDERLIFHNAYYDLVVLYFATGHLFNVYWDTLICGFLLNENEPHGLKYLYDKYVMNGEAGVHKFAELFAGIPFCYIPYTTGYIYGAHDAEMTMKLYEFQKPFMTEGCEECIQYDLSRVSKLYVNEELPLITVLVKMKLAGIAVSYDKISELRTKYLGLKDKALDKFNEAVSAVANNILNYISKHNDGVMQYPVNYNSPNQIAILLYDILGIKVIDKKAPRSTGANVISYIVNNEDQYGSDVRNIVGALSDVKKYDKVIGSFIDKIDKEARKTDGKIFADFNQTSARTGRLSSSGAINLQQIPSKLSDIRNIFTAGKNRVFIGADFSQQEMMAVASLANDEKMLASFSAGRDIYSHVASIAFGVPYEDCLEFYADGTTNKEGKGRRKQAKAICLGK